MALGVVVLLLAVVVFWVLPMVQADRLIAAKGFTPWAGIALGFFLGWLGVLVAALIPEKQGSARCPFCAERIQSDALVCRHCGREKPKSAARPLQHPERAHELD